MRGAWLLSVLLTGCLDNPYLLGRLQQEPRPLSTDSTNSPGSDAAISTPAPTTGPADAGSDAGAKPPPRQLVLVDNRSDQELNEYSVRIEVDTRDLIEAGTLQPDCSNWSAQRGRACSKPLPFWINASTCNTGATEVWFRLPSLAPQSAEVYALVVDAEQANLSDAESVFEFFHGFDGNALDTEQWLVVDDDALSVQVNSGRLRTRGPFYMESIHARLTSQTTVFGARLNTQSENGDDVEIGAARIAASDMLWHRERNWTGIGFVSFSSTQFTAQIADGSCEAPWSPTIGDPWSAQDGFQTVEFAFANQDDHSVAFLSTPNDAFEAASGPGCKMPERLPVYLVLDHGSAGDNPQQSVDYVYVRQRVPIPPEVEVLEMTDPRNCGPHP